METFNYQPSYGMKMNKKPSVNVVKFGDGYEQRSATGINNILRMYSVKFSGNEQKINDIDNFLTRHMGVTAFLWTPHRDRQGRFKCEEWDKDINDGYGTITATFTEVVA